MALELSKSFTEINITCACKSITGSVQVPSSALPLPIWFCHCNICRRKSGLLAITTIGLPKGSKELEVQGKPKAYSTSKDMTRFGCGECGTSMYEIASEPPSYTYTSYLCTGALTQVKGIVKGGQHIFVGDTKDRGLSVWLPQFKAWEEWSGRSKEVDQGNPLSSPAGPLPAAKPTEKLHCRCQCGGVEFNITPPNEESSKLRVGSSSKEKDSKAWWLMENGTKYCASFCACNSCRLGFGSDLSSWSYIPRANIEQMNGKSFDISMGKLKQHEISKGNYRNFCSECLATIFWYCDRRSDIIDVSIGIMQASSGARAEEWLGWRTRYMSYEHLAQNKPLMENLKAGLEKWGETRGVSAD